MVEKKKNKDSPRIGEQILADKLALEGAMDDAHEGELQDRENALEDKLGSKAWDNELKEYKHLSKEKAKVDRKKAKELNGR
jgi:hypothetical protein